MPDYNRKTGQTAENPAQLERGKPHVGHRERQPYSDGAARKVVARTLNFVDAEAGDVFEMQSDGLVIPVPRKSGTQVLQGYELTDDGEPAVVVTYSSANRQVTITATGGAASFNIWVAGVATVVTSPYVSEAHDATTGNHFLYWNGSEWVWDTTAWDLMLHAPAALVYYNATAASGVCFVETHTTSRDPAIHRRLHFVEGTVLLSGGLLSGYTLDTDTDAGVTFAISEAEIADEDLVTTISALSDNGPYTVWYRSGASGVWAWTTGLSLPFAVGATYPKINSYSAGTWDLREVSNLDFFTFYVLATPAITSGHGFVIVMGQSVYATQALAAAEQFAGLSLGDVPFQEFVVLAKVIVEAKSAYTNSYNAVLKAVSRITGNRASAVTTTSPEHNAQSGLQGGAAGEYYHLSAAQLAIVQIMEEAADAGTMAYFDGSTWQLVDVSTAAEGDVLTLVSGVPTWQAPAGP